MIEAGGGKVKPSSGTLTPAQFGRTTLWQLRHLYGFGGAGVKMNQREIFLNRCRILGLSEMETWKRWQVIQGKETG